MMKASPKLIALALLFLAAPLCRAQDANKIFKGYLTDKKCSEAVKDDSEPGDFLKQHTKDCALMPNCRKDGYVLYCNKEWLKLDSAGNKMAIDLLKTSKDRRGYFVEVKGNRQGDLLKVESMKELAEPEQK